MARLTAVVDLPTPPLPDATATNRRTLLSRIFSRDATGASSTTATDGAAACAVTITVALVTPSIFNAACSAARRTGSIAGPRCAGTCKAKLILLPFIWMAVTISSATISRPCDGSCTAANASKMTVSSKLVIRVRRLQGRGHDMSKL